MDIRKLKDHFFDIGEGNVQLLISNIFYRGLGNVLNVIIITWINGNEIEILTREEKCDCFHCPIP